MTDRDKAYVRKTQRVAASVKQSRITCPWLERSRFQTIPPPPPRESKRVTLVVVEWIRRKHAVNAAGVRRVKDSGSIITPELEMLLNTAIGSNQQDSLLFCAQSF
jgi:hypothetical protein